MALYQSFFFILDEQMSEDGNQGNLNENKGDKTKANKNVKETNGSHDNTNENAGEETDNNAPDSRNKDDQPARSEGDGATEPAEKTDREPDVCSLVIVNSYGSQDVQRLKDDPKITFKLSSQSVCVCVCVCVGLTPPSPPHPLTPSQVRRMWRVIG